MTCKNCGSVIAGKYCSKCSQEIIAGRLTPRELPGKFSETVTYAEHGIFRIVWKLSIHPVKVSQEYNEGRRKKYFSPVKYPAVVVRLIKSAVTPALFTFTYNLISHNVYLWFGGK